MNYGDLAMTALGILIFAGVLVAMVVLWNEGDK